MRDLYIVETPLQLLCAYEMITQRGNEYRLITRSTGFGEGRNDEQMQVASKALGLNSENIIIRPKYFKFDFIKSIPSITKFLCSYYNTVFIGSYYSRFMMTLSRMTICRSRYLLDDGIATFLAQKNMAASGRTYNLATFFHLPPLPGQEIIRHSFASLQERFPVTREGGGLFVGQNLVERNFLSMGQYLDIVKSSLCRSGGRIIYIPHRAEAERSVNEVSNLPGVEVVWPKTCIELHLLMSGGVPGMIFSSISSAAFTMSSLCGGCEIFLIVPSQFTSALVPHLDDVLTYADGISNISVVRLNQVREADGTVRRGWGSLLADS